MRCARLRRFRLRLSVWSNALQEPLHLARHLSRVVAARDRLQNVPSNASFFPCFSSSDPMYYTLSF